ncbi:hypothetical protein CDCA_CDCA18G4588 [Cyanidium caldarium]|uniref:Endoplasmic reticulum-Golgi intermediate compartment protein 3 n=1 Tax=Cyanidium caldarium TaxID=2771 RepID=A0AAV9J3F0_CYACA|nr:hypothetical protein CDCA_CDCA18G4588 [Cyanidium caldarium]
MLGVRRPASDTEGGGAGSLRNGSPLLHSRASWTELIRSLDAYPKTVEDVRLRTVAGGLLALVSYALIAVLVVSETVRWLHVPVRSQLSVESRPFRLAEPMRLQVEVDLLALDCGAFSLDVMQSSGMAPQLNVLSRVQRWVLDEQGQVEGPYTPPRVEAMAPDAADGTAAALTPAEERMLAGLDEDTKQQALEYRQQAVAFLELQRRVANGRETYCGPCFGADDDGQAAPAPARGGDQGTAATTTSACCNSCAAVRSRYQKRHWSFDQVLRTAEQCAEERFHQFLVEAGRVQRGGCRLRADLQVHRAAGNFHLAPGEGHSHAGGQHVHSVHNQVFLRTYNFSHRIHQLRFGPSFPGQKNALEGTHNVFVSTAAESRLGTMAQYFCKLVPVTYRHRGQRAWTVESYEYSATDLTAVPDHERVHMTHASGALPGIFVFYDLQPIHVEYVESREYGLLHFVVQLCAIVGGVFTVSGLLDRVLFGAGRALAAHKRRMRKHL